MATALQQQLSAIAAKSTHQLDLKAQRQQHSKSLIFEARNAANQTFDTLYQICLEGFQDLCALDSRFVGFSRTLFSEQSKGEDRTQMTAGENQELDEVIQSFLGLVCGRVLLRPAIKAVEWLVRRFRVHEYNTGALILTFLPYHANSIFPTLLSILPKQLPPTYRFLQPYVTSLASPPRHAIVHAAINNPGVFTALNDYTLSTARKGFQSAALVGFWASTMAQTVHGQLEAAQSGRADVRRTREEDLLLKLLPVLQEALRLGHVPELYLGSCMVITILVTKTSLEDKVLDGLMDAIARSWSLATTNDGLTCLSVIAEEKESLALSKTTSAKLLAIPDIIERLDLLSQHVPVRRLYLGLAQSCVYASRSSSSSMTRGLVEGLLQAENVSRDQKVAVIESILSNIMRQPDASMAQEALGPILSEIAQSTQAEVLHQALVRQHIELTDLEVKLQLSLSGAAIEEALSVSEKDVVMDEVEREDKQSLIAAAMSALPERLADASFLSLESESAAPFEKALATIVQAKGDIHKITEHASMHPEQPLEQPSLLSFLMLCWSGNGPTDVRAAALHAASKVLSENDKVASDMQAALPYLLSALSDKARVVRRAAAALVARVATLYHASDKGKLPSDIKIWAHTSIYGAKSKDIKWLSSADSYKVVATVLQPRLEECVLDSEQLGRVVADAINASTSGHELKSSLRSAVCVLLSSHAVVTPVSQVRHIMLSILSRVGKTASTCRTQVIIPAIKARLHQESGTFDQSTTVAVTDKLYIDCLSARTTEELTCLLGLAGGDFAGERSLMTLAYGRLRALWSAMKPEAQKMVATSLLDQALDEGSDEVAMIRQSEALEVLRQVRLHTDVLVSFLESVPDLVQMPDKPPATKRRRTSKTQGSRLSTSGTADTHAIVRRLTLVLELIEASKPGEQVDLLKGLFHVLGKLQDYRINTGSDLVYLQQMVISSLLSIVDSLKGLKTADIDKSVLRADLVVECVRSTSSTQVHNAALLLISSLATWAPDVVLHSVMPIFTFMSTTILRQSDDYSAHIIDQTVSRVVPPLVASLRKKNQDLITGAAELLLSFTAAFEHIPLHRRLGLFSHLVTALGVEASLPVVVAMLSDKYVSDRRVPQFTFELMDCYSPVVQLKAAANYLDLVIDAVQPKRTLSEAVLGFTDKSPAEIDESLRHLLLSLSKLLARRSLQGQLAKTLQAGDGTSDTIHASCADLLEMSLSMARMAPRLSPASDAVVSACLGLLPTSDFIASALPLLESRDTGLRLRVLQSIEQRAEHAKLSDEAARKAMLASLPVICAAGQDSNDSTLSHTAITCVDRITEKYGKKDVPAVLAASSFVMSDAGLGSSNDDLRIISLLCLSSMVDTIQDDIVSQLPLALNKSLEYLSEAITGRGNQRLHDAAFSFLGSVLQHLPWMISASALKTSLELSYQSATLYDSKGVHTVARSQFYSLVCKKVDIKVLLGALGQSFDRAAELGPKGCNELLVMLQTVVKVQSKSVILKNSSAVFAVLLRAFDLRHILTQATADSEGADLDALDNLRDSITLDVVMKLNDSTFRPFFVRLVEWATAGSTKKEKNQSIVRCVTLYGFLSKLSESLKSIVTSYASYVLDNAAALIKQIDLSNPAHKQLLPNILSFLSSSFEHDQDDFWQSPSHFTPISESLLTQLSNPSTLANAPTQATLISTIAALATATTSQDQHRDLNAALLKNTRADDASVRLAAVKCEQAVTDALGEDWLALLPEMLPFISELQEDDDEDVEREALGWIKNIEGVLGESLQGMLQ